MADPRTPSPEPDPDPDPDAGDSPLDSLGFWRRPAESWRDFSRRLEDAFGLLLLFVSITYVVTALLPAHGWGGVAPVVAGGATGIVALTSSKAHRHLVRVSLALVLAATVLAVVQAISDDRELLGVALVIAIVVLVLGMLAVLRRVGQAREVTGRTLLGAIGVYVSLGLLFTFLYVAIDHLQGGQFFETEADPTGGDFIFFSYTTLTTTGYGDLVPGGQPGDLIAGVQMMVGQIFLVVLVAGLVTLWRPGERWRRASNEPEPDG